ncbi:MAG: hypothetical protein GY774_21680 [Planctomycetes bacterium]|nr:hypothetical protein [Planctomycetota bacterium]
MEKAKIKFISSVSSKLVNLIALLCIVCFIANIAPPFRNSGKPDQQGKSNISKPDSPIILLSSTIHEVQNTDSTVLNESETKSEDKSQMPEKVQMEQENTENQQSDLSEATNESATEGDIESDTETESSTEDNTESNTERYIELPGEWEIIEMRVTAYCPCPHCCGEYSDGITANGHEIQPGDTFVAADGRYPFDTEMLIPDYSNSQPVKVLDRGGAIKGNKLDVFFATHEEALEWGVQYLEVNVRKNL